MVILTLANGKTFDASSPVGILGEMNPKDIAQVTYTQKNEQASAESWAKSLNEKYKKNIVAKKVDSGKGKQPFDSVEKKTLYGAEVGKLLDQIRPLVDKVNEAINKSHHHTLKLYFDYTNGKDKQETPAAGENSTPEKKDK